MNNERRKLIDEAFDKLGEIATFLRDIGADEREYYENMPESIQYSEKGERADEVASWFEEKADELDEIANDLEDQKQ